MVDAPLSADSNLRTFINSAPVAIVAADRAGILQVWNSAAERMLGWRAEEVIGVPNPSIPPGERERLEGMLVATLAGQAAPPVESVCQRKDGTVIPVQVSSAPLRDQSGAVTGYVAVLADASEREWLQTIVTSSLDAVISIDTDGVVVRWNPQAAAIFGWTKDEAVGRRLSDLVIPHRYRPDHQLGLLRFRQTGEGKLLNRRIEIEALHRSGYEFPVELTISTSFVQGGHVFTAFVRDISERRRSEMALIRAEEFRQRVLESTSEAIAAMDLEGRFTLVNRRLCEMTGHAEDDLVGESFAVVFPPESLAQVTADFATAVQGVPLRQGEANLLHKDGTRRTISYNLTPLVEEGKIAGVVGTWDDVSQRKKLEEQFHQMQRLESIGRLAGGVAHDFNNLMTAIIGNAQLGWMALPPDHPVRTELAEIQATAERAATLTQQLLAFSRRQIIAARVIDLNELIARTGKMVRRLIGEDIELVLALQPRLDPVRVDPGQFEQVIVNLAVNARDAMPRGGKLTIQTTHVDLDANLANEVAIATPGRYVLLTMTDNGIGMSEEVRQRAFEPFFTTKEQGRGTGLGLATCYGIVKQAGGNIILYSEVGVGTSFKIYVPGASGSPERAAAISEHHVVPKGEATILLVEDEASVRGLAARVLAENGYRVLQASDGAEALAIARGFSDAIELLVTDVIMPQIGGKELSDLLRPERPEMKVLFTSGYADDAIIRHGVIEEGVAFLQKPYSPILLAEKVREALMRDA